MGSSGIARGSHLASILFVLFSNDLKSLHSRKLLFADELKLCRLTNSLYGAFLLQFDLNILIECCKINKLMVDIDKCKVMSS